MKPSNLPYGMDKIRNDFPMLRQTMHGKPLVYFDTAATAQKPEQVISTLNQFYSNNYATVHRAIYEISVEATKAYQDSRIKAKQFINAKSADEIIFTRGTTESINLVASSFSKRFINRGDEILITEMEHHSNIVPWQMVAEERGAVLKVVPFNDQGILDYEAFLKLLTPKTKIVSVTHISNALGTVNPIEKIIEAAHEKGAKVLIDACQSAPHRKLDVQKLDCDFLVFSGHKVYGPTGIGVLYGKKELLDELPPYQGGGDMIETVTFEKTTYNVVPLKFEAGTPLIAQAIGLKAALDYLDHVGLDKIEAHEAHLTKTLTDILKKNNRIRLIGDAPDKGSIVTFTVEGIHPLDVGTMLDLKGFAIRTGHLCAQPTIRHFGLSAVDRVSFGLYNTEEEVHRFSEALNEVIKLF